MIKYIYLILLPLYIIFSSLYANENYYMGENDISGIYKSTQGYLKYNSGERLSIKQSILFIEKISNKHYGYYLIKHYKGHNYFNTSFGGIIYKNNMFLRTAIDHGYSKAVQEYSGYKIYFTDPETLIVNNTSLNAYSSDTYKKIYPDFFTQKEQKAINKAKKNYQDFYLKYAKKPLKIPTLF